MIYPVHGNVTLKIKPILETSRMIFRTWQDRDLDLAQKLWGDPRVMNLITCQPRLSQAEIRDRLIQEIALEREFGVQYWPLFLKIKGAFIGCCGLRPYDLDQEIYELGVHICAANWRCGFASEAVIGVIHYAFQVMQFNGIFAGHNPRNSASPQLLKKLGFRYTHDEFYPATGLSHPSYLLTSADYDQLYTTADVQPEPEIIPV